MPTRASRGARPARRAARRHGGAPRLDRALAQPQRRARRSPAATILLVADDDVIHPPGAYAASAASSPRTPGSTSSSAARSTPTAGRASAPCPAGRLTRLNAARASSHEIALRLAPVRAAGVRFDEDFGVGAGTEATLGEEYVFLADGLAAGLAGVHDPLPVSVHPHESSGFVWEGEAQARARALVFARVFGRAAPAVRLAFALKNARRFAQLAPTAGLPARLRRPLARPLQRRAGEVVGEVEAGAGAAEALDLAVERPGRPRRAELAARERGRAHPVVGEHLGQARGRRAPAAAAAARGRSPGGGGSAASRPCRRPRCRRPRSGSR